MLRVLPAAASAALLTLGLGMAVRADAASPRGSGDSTGAPVDAVTPSPVKTAPAVTRSYSLTLKQLGALFPLQLRGIQGTSGVTFGVRDDEVVVGAKLHLRYSYSPALLSSISHVNVLMNEEVAATIPVPRDQAGMDLERDISIPPRLVTEFNRLNLQLIGHYTLDCEDPAHTSLWANISNASSLELTVAPLALANDLALLPEPLFDRRDVTALSLPFVFGGSAGDASLEAAGILSSWFGALAGYRTAQFPASTGQIPAKGPAVVFLTGSERIPGLNTPTVTGPTLSMVPNPSDPSSKLLLVMGRDPAELKIAASAVAVGSKALSGQTATISQWQTLTPRLPYDAPNWLRSDRPVKFGELAEQRTFNVSGYSPDLIRINLRMPPDLFAWREKGIPVDLKYRYTPRPSPDKSTLNINLNENFLRAYPLKAANHQAESKLDSWIPQLDASGMIPAHEKFNIPLFMLPSKTQMQFHYYYDYVKQGACKDVVLDNVRGAIDADSTVDISHFDHYLAMPDLAAFGNSGFPFTRLADLSQTVVVMPDSAKSSDWTAYLDLMGLMGASTGYPATGVTVTQAEKVDQFASKDLLVLASGTNQPLLERWKSVVTANVDGSTKRFSLSDLTLRLTDWWNPDHRARPIGANAAVQFTSDSTQALITGFESPLQANRSVVLVSGSRPEGLANAVSALLDPDRVKNIQGSAVVVRDKQVTSLVAEQKYYVGRLGPLRHIQWFLSHHPLLLVLAGLVSALLLSMVLYLSLRARARARLKI